MSQGFKLFGERRADWADEGESEVRVLVGKGGEGAQELVRLFYRVDDPEAGHYPGSRLGRAGPTWRGSGGPGGIDREVDDPDA
jgi:hypothetical protein